MVLWIRKGLSVIFGAFFGFFILFQCNPIHNFWTLTRSTVSRRAL